ncbi:MAG: sulfotransferase [Myxococcales bacterium]|nr:sulfotransferase [Myxococcales bacterium]MDD9972110.1 sulfotransferase [Myxococcales bacterium]
MLSAVFDPEALIAAACEANDTNDLWGDAFREPLDVLSGAIAEEAGLYPARSWRMARWVLELLETRGRIAERLKVAGPEVAAIPIERPIIITGLPRTGTTLLHNLLSTLEGLRSYSQWEMRYVVPESDAGVEWKREAIADTDAELRALYERVPRLAKIHTISVDAPDECHWLTRHSFASLIFGYTLNIPSYTRWLLGRSQARAYAEHRCQLQLLAQRDGEVGQRLVLKDPGHLWALSELANTYPDALIVRLHRDPAQAVPSLCSLMHTLQAMDSQISDPTQVGPFASEMVACGLERERAFRKTPAGERVFDVEYEDLVGDPIGTVRSICARAGHPLDELAITRLDRWLGRHPQHAAGRHVYQAEDFGLRADELRERFGRTANWRGCSSQLGAP